MKEVKISWSELIGSAIARRIEEERRRNLAKAVLMNEKLRRGSRGEPAVEEIIRAFREARYSASSG